MTKSIKQLRPSNLLVVGAAGGHGRWLTAHILSRQTWQHVYLLDITSERPELAELAGILNCPVSIGAVADHRPGVMALADGTYYDLSKGRALAICLALPSRALGETEKWLRPLARHAESVCVVTQSIESSLAMAVRPGAGASQILFGLHPLFEPTSQLVDGQNFVVSSLPSDNTNGESTAASWLEEAIHQAGGVVTHINAAEHDAMMSYVQAMTHQMLLIFAQSVTSAPVSLERLWSVRTPLFEALFGLCARMLAPARQSIAADIQVAHGGGAMAIELQRAEKDVSTAISGSANALEDLIEAVRARIPGGLFETIQATAAALVAASQLKRSELARLARTEELVGIQVTSNPERLHVGRILEVQSTTVTLDELMVGPRGRSCLLTGPGFRNAARLGVAGAPRRVVVNLGHVELLAGEALDSALNDWLGFFNRDIRFLVPESVAGIGVLAVVERLSGSRPPQLISEVVRTGQRSVVVRVPIRADHDVDEVTEQLRAGVQESYQWPIGVSMAARSSGEITYLGPPGTFSESAARQAAITLEVGEMRLRACENFEKSLEVIADDGVAVLPITSSASGIVPRTVTALLAHNSALVVGGVVDVPVRFDAYIPADCNMDDMKGARVFSHPQGLAQCSRFVARFGLVAVPCNSTVAALQIASAEQMPAVALAPAGQEERRQLKVGEREIDDLFGSITRFLILGHVGAFGDVEDGSDPTLRSIWVSAHPSHLLEITQNNGPALDEILSGAQGESVLVTSRSTPTQVGHPGVKYLGRAPWSPRTPVVRVDVTVER